MIVGLPRNVRHLRRQSPVALSPPSVTLREVVTRDGLFDDEFSPLRVDLDLVAAFDAEPLPELLRDRHLPSLAHRPPFGVRHTYLYHIHTQKVPVVGPTPRVVSRA